MAVSPIQSLPRCVVLCCVILQRRSPMSVSSSCLSNPSLSSTRPSAARAAPRPTKKPSSVPAGAPGAYNVSGLPLSDVGLGGGRVEDGTAWSMVARFVCSVPGCGASFTLKQNLQRHQTQKHGRAKTVIRPASFADDEDDDDDDDNEDDDSGLPPPFF